MTDSEPAPPSPEAPSSSPATPSAAPAPVTPVTPVTPATPTPPAATLPPAAAGTVARPQRVRWGRLLMVALPVAAVLLGGWHLYKNSDHTREQERIAQARKRLMMHPEQPEEAYGYWRHLLEDPKSSPSLQAQARVEIQQLIDHNRLPDRFEALITDLLRRGERDLGEAIAYARVLETLDREYRTAEKPEAAQARIARLIAIRDGYKDALNDKVERGQFEKALEKLSALHETYPEAEFVRPVVARLLSEVADALITLDDLEGARDRLIRAVKIDPLPAYQTKLESLEGDIQERDPAPYLAAGKQAESEGRWPDAQAQYEQALRLRRSNKDAAAGYTRILKFYAEIFLKNAEEQGGELSEQGMKFVELAEQNARKMDQYGDAELVLARAELLLAESHFAEEDIKKSKQMADACLAAIGRQYRTTQDGSYLMARVFKLYYHLGKNMNRQPQAVQSLALADEYCRYALEKGHPKAGALFIEIHRLARIEQDAGAKLLDDDNVLTRDSGPTGDVRNLVNEGPLGADAPLDVIANAHTDAAANPARQDATGAMAAPATPAPLAPAAPTAPAANPAPAAEHDPLLNPLRPH